MIKRKGILLGCILGVCSVLLPPSLLPSGISDYTVVQAWPSCPGIDYTMGMVMPAPAVDSDGDGIYDCLDMCPQDPENECYKDSCEEATIWLALATAVSVFLPGTQVTTPALGAATAANAVACYYANEEDDG